MDSNQIRTKILEVLYDLEKNNPGNETSSNILKKVLDVDYNELNFNINYLENEDLIHVTRFIDGNFLVKITYKGVNLAENPENLNSRFPINRKIITGYKKAFMSYSTLDKDKAAYIKDILKDYDIKCFMASEDTKASEEWMDNIIKEISDSDFFISILSHNFKQSNWCPQEVGIACYLKFYTDSQLQIIPLWIDENFKPFGFLSRIQGQEYSEINLISPIFENNPNYMIPKAINALGNSHSYDESDFIMGLLEPYYGSLNDEEVNELATNAVKNNQVYGTGKCRAEYIPLFIKINRGKIEPNTLIKLLDVIKDDDEMQVNEKNKATKEEVKVTKKINIHDSGKGYD